MPQKQKHGEMRTRLTRALAAMAAGAVARKAIDFAWTRITGKTPPDDPHDPQVALTEAIGFAVVMGATMELARLLAGRAASKRAAAAEKSAD